MRKFIGFAVVIAFLWVAAAPAQAINLQPGENYAKLVDYSSFYNGNTPIGVPGSWSTFDPTTLIGAELRAIFKITDMSNQWNPAAPAYWTEVATDGSALTGLVYDLAVAEVSTFPGGFVLLLTPMAGSGDPAAVPGSGGQLDVWSDATPDFDNTLGPGLWNDSLAGHDGHDDYPTASDIDAGGALDPGVSLWLRADFVPIGLLSDGVTPFVFAITMQTSGTGIGTAFADVTVNNTGLPISGSVDFPDPLSPVNGGDLRIIYNLTLAGNQTVFSGWQVQSNDPIEFFALPEPASMSLLLVGLFGGAGAYWRRRRAA